ncbi:hypothetical protein [Xanthocytophaga agilis]|uniref:STAS/SEC14 domain-containing protein n=1 Tax=Xanthocytophaga agilis TaxID=3048010 RepID=A0AAE3R6B5_9BACT|nr:hypothetical protein [Xanthocytophaga agilis]MDJ1502407.1 hypothetical protein [Xanthocytophaga agilis]
MESSYLSVGYNRELNAVIASWSGYISADEAKSGFERIWEVFRYYEANYVIADLREYEGGFGAITQWLDEEYMPKMIKIGYQACANVMPEDFFMSVSLNDFQNKQSGIVPLRVFADLNTAQTWISQLQTSKNEPTPDALRAVA